MEEGKEFARSPSLGTKRPSSSALFRDGTLGCSSQMGGFGSLVKGLGGPTFDFSFAFKDSTFADCKLKLYIEPPEDEKDACGEEHGEREREDSQHSSVPAAGEGTPLGSETELSSPLELAVANTSQSLSRFLAVSPTPEEVARSSSTATTTTVEHASLEPGSEHRDEPPGSSSPGSTTPRSPTVREIPVTAVVLAAKSTFFLKLFTVGMSESLNKGTVMVHLTAKEEPVMHELLSFIYKGSISPYFSESFEQTLQLLLLADRFGVEECFAACVDRLNEELARISVKEALQFVEIPANVQEYPALRPLGVVSHACIVDHFGPLITNPSNVDLLSLSLAGLRAMLKADNLPVENEERVFIAVISWAKHNYKDLGIRRDVVAALVEDVRFPWMTAGFIKATVMGAPEMRTESSRNLVVDALLFMAAKEDDAGYTLVRQMALRDSRSWCRPRLNFMPPVKSVYFDIPLNYCKAWAPNVSFQATSGPFCAAGKWFTLNAKLETQKEGGPRFGLFLRLDKGTTFPNGEVATDIECQYRFCVKTLSSAGAYQVVKPKSACTFSEPYHGWGSRDLFRKPWQDIIANAEVYFPDGAMQFRADLWIERD